MEPFQIIQLPSQENKLSTEYERSNASSLDTYVGIIHEFNSPFHLYINLSRLGEDDYTKLIIYSIGSKKEIIWGIYDVVNNKFEFESACKYQLKQLIPFIRQWENVGYEYIANAVTDRIHLVMASFNPNNKELTRDEYKILKFLIAYLENKIEEDEFLNMDPENTFPRILEKIGIANSNDLPFIKFLNQNLKKIKEILEKYEQTINRIDVDKEILRKIINNAELLQLMVSEFYEIINEFNDNAFYNALKKCKSEEECTDTYGEECSIYKFLRSDQSNFI